MLVMYRPKPIPPKPDPAIDRHQSATAAECRLILAMQQAVQSSPIHRRVDWLYSICADLLTDDEIEDLGNRLGRVPGDRARAR